MEAIAKEKWKTTSSARAAMEGVQEATGTESHSQGRWLHNGGIVFHPLSTRSNCLPQNRRVSPRNYEYDVMRVASDVSRGRPEADPERSSAASRSVRPWVEIFRFLIV